MLYNNFTKAIYIKKTFVGERIRDLMYIKNEKMILFAIESSGSIGILKNENL